MNFLNKKIQTFFSATLDRRSCIVNLEFLTFCYLTLPALLWIFGWLQFIIAIPLALGLIYCVTISWRETKKHCSSNEFLTTEKDLPLWSFGAALLLGVVWSIYSGAGGFTYSNPDWIKHYSMLRDLTEGTWPVSYSVDNNSYSLVFYLAYYLPAAAMAKLFGWWVGCFVLLLWTMMGILLAISWLTLLVGRYPLLATFLFIFAGGLDFIGERIVAGGPMPPGDQHIDWWAGLANIPGNYSQILWAPQHSLVAWTITGLLAVQISSNRKLSHAFLLVALASFWSPFSIIGFIPLGIIAWIKSDKVSAFSIPNLFALLLLLATTLFYLSRNYSSPHGFVWELSDLQTAWPRFLLLHLFEWFLFFFFAKDLRRSENPWLRHFFWTAAACLLLYPIYSYGFANDWVMRTTIPAMFLLWVGVARSLFNYTFDLENRLLVVLLIFGTFGVLHESSRSWNLPSLTLTQQTDHGHIPELENPYRDQYLGQTDSFFFKYLARPSQSELLVPPALPPAP